MSEDSTRLFSVVPRDRTRSNGHKLKHKKFYLNMWKSYPLSRTLDQLPREGMETPYLE